MEIDLTDRVAVVTGAGRNLGEGIASLVAECGAKVAVVDRDGDAAERVVAEINRAYDGRAAAFQADMTNEEDVRRVVDAIGDRLGPISALVNSLARSDHKNIFDIDLEEWNATIGLTLTALFLSCKYVAASMVASGTPGAIVNISSTYADMAKPDGIAYPVSKAALYSFNRTLALQLAPHHIRVVGVLPDQVGSPVGLDEQPEERRLINLVGRLATPRDVAQVVAFLLSEEASFVTGVSWMVDGGALTTLSGWPRKTAAQEGVILKRS